MHHIESERASGQTVHGPQDLVAHTSHPMTAQKGPSKRGGGLIQGDNCSFQILHSIPQGLTMEIILHCTNEAQANP